MENQDILKMYNIVFEDMVKCYLENLTEEEQSKISDEVIKSIAYKMIYKNDYLWEVINETIASYLENEA